MPGGCTGFGDSLVLVAWGLLQGNGLLSLASPGKALFIPCCRSPLDECTTTDRPANTWGYLNSTVASECHCLSKELRQLALPPPSPFLHIPSALGFVQLLFFTPLVGVKWISLFSCEFPRLLIRLISHLDFLCVKCPSSTTLFLP